MGASRIDVRIYSLNTGGEEELTIQCLPGHRPCVRREEDSDNPSIPEDADELERLAPPSQTPLRLGEAFRRAEQTTEADQTIRSSAGHAGRRDEGGEGDVRWQDGASHQSGHAPDDDDSVTGLATVHLGDPAGEWEDTVSGDGENEAGSGDDGDGSVL